MNEPDEEPDIRNRVLGDYVVTNNLGTLSWSKISECLLSPHTGNYFPLEFYVDHEGLIYRRTACIEVDGVWTPNSLVVLDVDGNMMLRAKCVVRDNGGWIPAKDAMQARYGGYSLIEELECINGYHYESQRCVTLSNGERCYDDLSILVDGQLYHNIDVVSASLQDGGVKNVLIKDAACDHNSITRLKIDIVDVGRQMFIGDAVEVDDKWEFRHDCRQVNGAWYFKDAVVSVEGINCLLADYPTLITTHRLVDATWYPADDCTPYEGRWYLIEDCHEIDGVWIPEDNLVFLIDLEEWALSGWELRNDECVSRGADGYVFSGRLGYAIKEDDDDYIYVDRYDDYVHIRYYSTCPVCDEGYDNQCDNQCCRSDRNRPDRINRYHRSPDPTFFRDSSGWDIGFEVEKTEVGDCSESSEVVEEQALFCGWEEDGSCGVEGITHVYGLHEKYDLFRSHVKSSWYVDGPTSDSCGGHVNVSRQSGLTLEDVRPYVGLIYALYRERLNNTYSRNNKQLNHYDREDGYTAIKAKNSHLLEFRLVDKVNDGADLLWRFKLFQILSKAIERKWSYEHYLKMNRELFSQSFDKDEISEHFSMSRKFRKWLMDGKTDEKIASYC